MSRLLIFLNIFVGWTTYQKLASSFFNNLHVDNP